MRKGLSITIVLLLAGTLFLVFLSGCLKTEPESETIKIVTSLPMREVTSGQDIINGVKLALKEADYQVDHFKIELVVEDDGDETGAWQEDIEREIANRAVADPEVMIYLGTYNSGAAKVSIPITNKAGLVQISPANTWPGLTQPGFLPGEPGSFYPTGVRNYFRVVPTDALQGPAGAIWAKELGVENVYIFDDGEAYGKGIAGLFEEIAKEIGLNVVGRMTLPKQDDYTSELKTIMDLDVDLIYFGGITPNGAVPLIKGVKEILGVKFMGPDGLMENTFIEGGGVAAEGAYLTTVGLPPAELKTTTFYHGYVEEYGTEPIGFSAFGYEAAKVALLAIERARTKDRARILEEVSKITDYDGLFGIWSFDQNGDTTLSVISRNRVKQGDFVFERLEESNIYEIREQIRTLGGSQNKKEETK